MRISVIICTIRRVSLLCKLFDSLNRQSHSDFEVLVVTTEGDSQWRRQNERIEARFPLHFLTSPPGLSRARNVGLRKAQGEVVCFLDDDVVLEDEFLQKVQALFQHGEHADVGGITGYDSVNYGRTVPLRWRLRRIFGVTPTLEPGSCTHLGRNVPLNILKPFKGCRPVGWLPGFCQVFRKEAIQGLYYDEATIAAEDRDFSMEVNRNWRLLICGDAVVEHYHDQQGRVAPVRQIGRAAFGLGRCFAKRRQSSTDWLAITRDSVGEAIIDLLALAAKPSRTNLQIIVSRQRGFYQGLRSFQAKQPHTT